MPSKHPPARIYHFDPSRQAHPAYPCDQTIDTASDSSRVETKYGESLSPGWPCNPYDPHAMFDGEMGAGYDLPLCGYHSENEGRPFRKVVERKERLIWPCNTYDPHVILDVEVWTGYDLRLFLALVWTVNMKVD
jgi:hypothetical protein